MTYHAVLKKKEVAGVGQALGATEREKRVGKQGGGKSHPRLGVL